MTERDYYLAFSLISGIGPKTFTKLLKNFKSAENAWRADAKQLRVAGLSDPLAKRLEKAKIEFNFIRYQEKLKLRHASFIALCDKTYPKLLSQIPNPPIVLFVKGEFSKIDFNKTIGIVGTRKITNYGREVTKLFSSELGLMGFTVVSGLALGVDAYASLGAIEVGAKTVAVLGNGVDLCFPSSNTFLYDKILQGNGVILSEFPLGQAPTVGSFPSRNRIIAGLSLGVLVTEGAKDSGSLITADYAFKFNRKVFAVPGPITSSLSVAPLKLIEKGAVLVTRANDISREFKIQNLKIKTTIQNSKLLNLTKEEEKIIQCLENEQLSFDEIARKTKFDASKLATILSMMEIKGVIKNTSGGYSSIN